MTDPPAPSPSPSSPESTQYRLELNNWLQSHKPKKELTWEEDKSGPDHAPTWHAACKLDDKVCGRGEGGKKAHAREEAARIALRDFIYEEETKPFIERRKNSPTP